MKLELKHLAPYLPYGLKCVHIYDKKISHEMGYYKKSSFNENWTIEDVLGYGKPILRPKKDLLTYEVDGRILMEVIKERLLRYSSFQIYERIENLPYKTMQQLFEHHFDTFGLIKAGLAIDINSLNK